MATRKDLPQDIGGFIRDMRQTARISLRQLAERAGVSNPYLSQIERGLRKPSAEVLQQLASALRVSTPAMYLRAGLLDSEGQQGVLAAIAADPELTIAQKQSLSQIYETFRNENARNAPPADEPPAVDSTGEYPAAGPAGEYPAAGPAGEYPAAGPAGDSLVAGPADEEALLAALAAAEPDRETTAVIQDVAAVENGATPAPRTSSQIEEKK